MGKVTQRLKTPTYYERTYSTAPRTNQLSELRGFEQLAFFDYRHHVTKRFRV
jgi:hypothetical protein